MGLFTKLKNEFIDIIEWLDPTNNTIVYRFERYQNEIKMGAKLTVRESQVAVFINEGQIADVFQPGMYTLTTQNMPILATLKVGSMVSTAHLRQRFISSTPRSFSITSGVLRIP